MASTELIVAFSAQVEGLTTSLKRVNSSLEELRANAVTAGNAIESNVSGLSRAFSSLGNSIKGAVLAYAGFAGVRALGEVAVSVDDLNSSLRRLQILTGQSAGSIQSLFANLNQIGAQTGASVQSLTDQFQRFYVATTAIGASSSQVQQLVTVLAQFGRLSSGGPQEAAAAITQLSQGLASGRLNGDELKSVLENMPQLAQALATALGVGVGELRKMGEEGKLTADVVFPALLRAGEGLTRQLAGLPLTLRQSFQVAMDGMTRAAQEADKAIGATEFLSRVFQWIGQGGQAAARRIGGGAPGIEAQQVAESEIARLRENLRLQEQIRDAELQRRANMPADQANRSINQERYRQVTQNVLTAQQQFEEASSGAVDRVLQNVGVIVNADNDALERRLNGIRESSRQTDQILTTIERRNNERLRISGKADEDRAAVRARMNSDMSDSERTRAERAIAMITAEEQKDLAAIATREGAAAASLARRTQREDDAQKLAADRRAQAAREAFLPSKISRSVYGISSPALRRCSPRVAEETLPRIVVGSSSSSENRQPIWPSNSPESEGMGPRLETH
jgi:tape measure domain-containing protein